MKNNPTSFKYQIGAAISEYIPILGIGLIMVLAAITQFGDNIRFHGSAASQELAGFNSANTLQHMQSRNQSAFGGSSGGGYPSTGGGSTGNSGDGSGNTGGDTSVGNSGINSGGESTTTGGNTGGASTGGGNAGGASTGGGNANSGGNTNAGDAGGAPHAGGGAPVDEPAPVEEESNLEKTLAWVADLSQGVWEGLKSQFWDLVNFVAHPIETAESLKNLAVGLVEDFHGTMQILIDELGKQFDSVASGDAHAIGKVIGENISPATLASIASRVTKLGRVAKAVKRLDTACSSFIAGTPIWTANGWQSVERITVGDKVWSRSDETFETNVQSVVKLLHRQVADYYQIDTGFEVIGVTEEHPFWLQGKGWIPASHLKAGNAIAVAEGDIVLKSVKHVKVPVSVYNFSVEKNHTYFVSTNKLWVHNANDVCTLNNPDIPSKLTLDDIAKDIPANKRAKFEADFKDPAFADAMLKNPELVAAWNKMDDLGADDVIRTNPGALDALNQPRGSRPDQSTYLPQKYIDDHFAKFDDGVVRVTTQQKIDDYGTLGGKEAFTMPKSEYDKVLAETGGDLKLMEGRLGLNPGDLTGQEAVIALIKREHLGEIKMPTGNEAGVIDDFWIPGGKTSGGVSEAIFDLSSPDLPYIRL